MSKPKEYSAVNKDQLMTYTFVALLAIAIISSILWSGIGTDSLINTTTGWNLGLTIALGCLIAVGVAVGLDVLLNKLTCDSQLNIRSSAVFGLIVALSYSLGLPVMNSGQGLPIEAPGAFIFIALISTVGLIVFKKVLGGSGRKIINPAAGAKFLVLLPIFNSVFIAADHLKSGMLQVPALAGPIGYDVINGNGAASFGNYLLTCFGNPNAAPPMSSSMSEVFNVMFFEKFHGWVGGASSLAVIIVGIALFIVARRYIKWRITLAYFVSAAIMSLLMSTMFADQDLLLRLMFTLFIGSSVFMAFFMATDPASTPLTYMGQIIFGAGLAVLTVLIVTYMNFFGGALLALIIMNLIAPKLDQFGKLKPRTEKKEPKLPKAKQFLAEKVKETPCIQCGACLRVCCHNLSPILIKQALDKQDFDKLEKLHADYCTGCGHCTFICPARIDLRKSVLTAKGMLRQQ